MEYIIPIGVVILIIIVLIRTARIVPQRKAFVVERLGKYSRTLEAGFHILIPFFDKIAYRHSLKEVAVDVPSQMCITQMRAERERRAVIAESEGQKEAKINVAEGEKQEVIKQSEAIRDKQVNEAEGKAKEIEMLATATAVGIQKIAGAIESPGGSQAVNLRIAEQYVDQFGNLAMTNNTLIIPNNLSDVGGMVAGLAKVLDGVSTPKSAVSPLANS